MSSLLGYLEWGTDKSTFLAEAELDIVLKLFTNPVSVVHPFVLLPMAGQIILIITLFQSTPNKILMYIGIGSIGILLFFMFVIGIISLNYKITISTIPFIFAVFFTIRNLRSKTN